MNADNVINRIKNLREFEVQYTLPEDFRFGGKIPFDMDIVGDQAFVKVIAESMDEALVLVKEYFHS